MKLQNHSRNAGLRSTILGFGAAALIVVGLTSVLNARLALTQSTPQRNPLTVDAVIYALQDSYSREVSYLGLLVAGRKANLGFEIAGQISSLPQRQGSPVRQGEVIATLDDAALQARRRATAADLEQARAESELAQLKANRQRELRGTGAVSKQAYDETRLQAQAMSSRVAAVAARLESIDIDLEKSRLVAPYDGLIADRYVNEGAVVSPGTAVVRLMETASQEAHIGVAAARAAALEPGKKYTVKLRDQAFEADLLSVRPDVDPVTRTTTAVFAIPAQVKGLDGEPVTLVLQEDVPLKGAWLPITAMREGQRGLWTVYRLEPWEGSYRAITEAVEVLDLQGNKAYVRGSLPDLAKVVASGLHRITAGSIVVLQEDQ
ncbi:MAG: efflux RND transporter periplasmic adaptor subunit [Halioglobus sp.]